jgi:hypothetical protein
MSKARNIAAAGQAPTGSFVALTIRARKGDPLTGKQRIFNRLTKRIASLERKLEAGRNALENLLNRFLVEVGPAEQELARKQLELARTLSEAHQRLPLRKRQTQDVRFLILTLLDESFEIMQPDAAAVALHDEWAVASYDEGRERDHAKLKSRLAREFRNEFGFEADIPEGIDDSREGFALFRKLMEDQVRMADEASARGADARAGAKAGARPRDRGEAGKVEQRESLRKRSIREIYLALAKVLHPDAVADPKDRELREQSMKQAIAAYRAEDLVALLALEKRWGGGDKDRLHAASDDVLGVYLVTLQARAVRLARDLREQMFDPRFARIAPVVGLPEPRALAGLRDRADQLRRNARRLQGLLTNVVECRTKSGLAKLVDQYLDSEVGSLDIEVAIARAREN